MAPDPDVRLRLPVAEDAVLFSRLFDREVMRYVGDGRVRDLGWYRDFVRRQITAEEETGRCFLTVLAAGEVAGFTGLHTWDEDWGPTGATELGWRLGRRFWGRGIARAAGRRVLAEHGAQPLVAMIHVENTASQRLAGQLGFRPAERCTSPEGIRAQCHRRG